MSDYFFCKWVFRSGFIFLVLLLVVGWGQSGWGDPRFVFFGVVECPSDVLGGRCFNPLSYCSDSFNVVSRECEVYPSWLWEMDTLPAGFKFEVSRPFVVEWFWLFVILVFVFCFLLNHYLNIRRCGRRWV